MQIHFIQGLSVLSVPSLKQLLHVCFIGNVSSLLQETLFSWSANTCLKPQDTQCGRHVQQLSGAWRAVLNPLNLKLPGRPWTISPCFDCFTVMRTVGISAKHGALRCQEKHQSDLQGVPFSFGNRGFETLLFCKTVYFRI